MDAPPTSPHRVVDLAAWLAGDWSIDRDIDDGRGRYRGAAHFAQQAGGEIRWSEDGTLQLDAFEGPVARVLTVHPGAPWEVRFDDDRPFHPLDLTDGRCEVVHLCGPDTYRGTYEAVNDDHLAVAWHVTGPGRDDTIVSDYRRVASAMDGVRDDA